MLKYSSLRMLLIAFPMLASGGFAGSTEHSVEFASVSASEVKTGFSTITSKALAEQLAHKNFVLVNVHIPYEGEIERTDVFIPFDEIAENLSALPKERTAAIVLYCQSGRMSEIAADALVALGFTGVSHLAGGMLDWRRSGYQVLQSN